jgi:hypothetical protein
MHMTTQELVLIADTELLCLMRDQLAIPAGVQEESLNNGHTLFQVAQPDTPARRRELSQFKQTLMALGALVYHEWLTRQRALAINAEHMPEERGYIVAKNSAQIADYLGFGAVFTGPPVAGYRIIRVPREHLHWMLSRLGSGLQLGCTDVSSSYEDALAGIRRLTS